MKRFLSILLLFFLFVIIATPTAYAALTVTQTPDRVYANTPSFTLTFKSNPPAFVPGKDYELLLWLPGKNANDYTQSVFSQVNKNPAEIIIINQRKPTARATANDEISFSVALNSNIFTIHNLVGTWNYKLSDELNFVNLSSGNILFSGQLFVYQPGRTDSGGQLSLMVDRPIFSANSTGTVFIENAQPDQYYTAWYKGEQTALFTGQFTQAQIDGSAHPGAAPFSFNTGRVANRTICMTPARALPRDLAAPIQPLILLTPDEFSVIGLPESYCLGNIFITDMPIPTLSITPTPVRSNQAGIPTGAPSISGAPTPSAPPPTPPCSKPLEEGRCVAVKTGLGIEFSTTPEGFIKSLFSLILGLAGGVAVIIIILSGYKLMRSQGDPEAVKGAKETLTSAIVGLLFIIFSLVILQTIGVNILKLPGFSNAP